MDRFKGTNWEGRDMGREQSYQNQAGSKLRERVCQTGAVVAEETGDWVSCLATKDIAKELPQQFGKGHLLPQSRGGGGGEIANIYWMSSRCQTHARGFMWISSLNPHSG